VDTVLNLARLTAARTPSIYAGSKSAGQILGEREVANVQSAEKRNRQRIRRRARNLFHLTTMRTHVKRVRKAIEAKDAAKAKEELASAVRVIDKAAQKGVIDHKTASRKISRLTLAVRRAS
jgi:small subunit ribosomal protein S20